MSYLFYKVLSFLTAKQIVTMSFTFLFPRQPQGVLLLQSHFKLLISVSVLQVFIRMLFHMELQSNPNEFVSLKWDFLSDFCQEGLYCWRVSQRWQKKAPVSRFFVIFPCIFAAFLVPLWQMLDKSFTDTYLYIGL